MPKNSERFIAAFNRIENALKEMLDTHEYIPFTRSVDLVSKTNSTVRRYRYDLFEYADLRNAIVHERVDPAYVIAEPHDATVERIEKIEKDILEPEKVIPRFSRDVVTFEANDPLTKVLKVIDEKTISQFPVYDGKSFIGLITANGITNWLAHHIKDELVLLDTTLEEILTYEENKQNYLFIDRNKSLFEAEELFQQSISKGKPVDALLITHSGSQKESLLGIITPWDIIEIP